MKIWQRLVSFLNGIILWGMVAAFLLFSQGKCPLLSGSYLSWMERGKLWVVGLILATFLLGYLALRMAIHPQRVEKTLVNQTEHGEIQITLAAMENLAWRAVKKIKGVKDAHVRVRADRSGVVEVFIEVTANPDISIPQVLSEIRTQVEDYLYETTGIKVNQVKVLVPKVANEPKARVQ